MSLMELTMGQTISTLKTFTSCPRLLEIRQNYTNYLFYDWNAIRTEKIGTVFVVANNQIFKYANEISLQVKSERTILLLHIPYFVVSLAPSIILKKFIVHSIHVFF